MTYDRSFLRVIGLKILAHKGCKHLISVNFSNKPGDIIMSTFDEQMYHAFISILL